MKICMNIFYRNYAMQPTKHVSDPGNSHPRQTRRRRETEKVAHSQIRSEAEVKRQKEEMSINTCPETDTLAGFIECPGISALTAIQIIYQLVSHGVLFQITTKSNLARPREKAKSSSGSYYCYEKGRSAWHF